MVCICRTVIVHFSRLQTNTKLYSNCRSDLMTDSDVCTFHSLGVVEPLCVAIKEINWTTPTEIQQGAIPEALKGKDIIGLAETGSGKTGAFAIPILQALLASPQRLFAVILAPTRELAFQIHEVFVALGSSIALNCACIVGGVDMLSQAIALAKKPHVIIATPGVIFSCRCPLSDD